MAEVFDFGLQQHKIKMDGKFFENNLFAVAGDTGRRLEVQLLDSNNMVQNTTGISLRLNADVAGQATYAEATLVDATQGLYELDLPNGMLISPGNWQFQWQIIGTSGEKLHSFAFTGSVGSNLSEGGSEATNFYLNADELKQMQEDFISGAFDSSVLETNIAEKLTDLEMEYLPRLTELDAELGQKVGGGKLATMADMAQDVKIAMAEGSVAVVGVNGTVSENVVDGQIKPRNTSFMKASNNLLNPSETFIGTVGIETGEFYPADTNYWRSGFIKIKPNDVYKFLLFREGVGIYFFRIAWYTSEYEFISGEFIDSAVLNNLQAPSNAVFCVVCADGVQNRKETYFFGDKNAQFSLYEDSFIKSSYLQKDSKNVVFYSENLIDSNKTHVGKLIDDNLSTYALSFSSILSLETSNNSGHFQTEPTQVDFGKTYSLWYGDSLTPFGALRTTFYSENMKLIEFDTTRPTQFTIDNRNIKYVSFGESNGYSPNALMLKEGAGKPDKFLSYKKEIDFDGDFPVLQNEYYQWKDKKICTYGTSITQYGFWQEKVMEKHLFSEHYLRGFSGSTISNAETLKWWVSSVDGSVYGSENDFEGSPNQNAILIDAHFSSDSRVATIPFDSDIVLLEGGTNDMAKGVPIGDTAYSNGYVESTFKGGIASTIKKIQDRLPNAVIVFTTPIYNVGNDIRPYCAALQEVCDEFGIEVIDVHGKSGINRHTANRYLKEDGVHPTYGAGYTGADRISNVIIGGLKTIMPITESVV